MSAVVTGPAKFQPAPTFSLTQRVALGALVRALDEPSVSNLSDAFLAIAGAFSLDTFCLANLDANSRIVRLADTDPH